MSNTTDPHTDPAAAAAAAAEAAASAEAHEANEAAEDVQDDAVIARAFWGSVGFVLVLGAVGFLVWWSTRPPKPELPTESGLTSVREQDEDEGLVLPSVPFTDVTREAGIDFVHESGARGQKLLPETMGGGVAFFDYDGDGDPDLLFTNGRPWPGDERRADRERFGGVVLYRNDGRGTFEDVTKAVGLDVDLYAMGVAAGDYDGDGRIDLYVTALGRNRLFRNVGERFEDVTAAAGVGGADEDWGTSAGWFDLDRDGDLDLFVCNYVEWSAEYDLAQDFTLVGGKRAYGRPQNFEGSDCVLYRNAGDGTFEDVSERAGIRVANRDTGVPMAKSLGVTFADLDRDGWLDVVVANDTVPNFLFHNQRDGTFKEVAALQGIAYDNVTGNARGAMGIDIAPFRNDETIGIAIGNFANEMSALYVAEDDEMQFDDQANANGLGATTRLDLTFGMLFLDADNDGRLDLFSANGHLEEDVALNQTSQTYEQPPRLFWNAGAARDAEFVDLPEDLVGPDLVRPMVGRGAACADIDGDGDVDIAIAACGRAPRLLRNDQELGHHWLAVNFGEANAIGAQLDFELSDGRVLRRFVTPTRSYLSQSEPRVLVGIGAAEAVDRIHVRWPDGGESTAAGPFVDRNLTLRPPGSDDPPSDD